VKTNGLGIESLGGSLFWILAITSCLFTLGALAVWAFHSSNIQGGLVAMIAFFVLVTGILLSKGAPFDSGTWSENSLSFILFFFLYLPIGIAVKANPNSIIAVFSVTGSGLLSVIATSLPGFLWWVLNQIIMPISEDVLIIFGIPAAVLSMLSVLAIKIPILGNKLVQLVIIGIVAAAMFALLHVAALVLPFIISAMVFTIIRIVAIFGDASFDWFKKIKLMAAGALGAHIGHNIGVYGVIASIDVLLSRPEFGIPLMAIFLLLLFSALNQIGLLLFAIKTTIGSVSR